MDEDLPASIRRRFASFRPEGPRLGAEKSSKVASPDARSSIVASDSDDGEDAPRSTLSDDDSDWLAIYVLLGFVIFFGVGVVVPSVFDVSGRALSAGGLGFTLLGVSLSIFSPGGLSTWMVHAIFVAAGGLGLCVGGLVGNTVSLTV